MGFRLIALAEYEDGWEALSETERLSGNVVAGRADYNERDSGGLVVDNIDVGEFLDIDVTGNEGHYGMREWKMLSRNHLLVAERLPKYEVDELKSKGAESVTSRFDDNGVVWDLKSKNGTDSLDDTYNGSPIYEAGRINLAVENIPDFYLGFEAGSDLDGTENDIHEMKSNMDERGFETYAIEDAEWSDVVGHARHISRKSDPESTVFFQYSGHGTENGQVVLEDRRVPPQNLLDLAGEADGRKVVMVDQCYAGNFLEASLPEDMMVLYSSGEDRKSYETQIDGKPMGRYAGRLVNRFEDSDGEIDLEKLHQELEDVTKIEYQGAGYEGTSIEITGVH